MYIQDTLSRAYQTVSDDTDLGPGQTSLFSCAESNVIRCGSGADV